MRSIGSRWAGALLAAAWLGCGGDAGDPGRAAAPDADLSGDLELATSEHLLEDDDSEITPPDLMGVLLSPDPPVPGEVIRAVARVEDGGEGYTLRYRWNVAGREIEDDSGAIVLPMLRRGERIEVTVTARNAAGTSEAVSVETEVENTAPVVMDLRVQERYGSEGALEGWEANAWARDADGDDIELEYTWFLNDRPTDVDTTIYPTDALKRGDRVSVQVVASDGDDESEIAESGVLEVGNSSPEIVSTPPRLDDSGRFTYEIEVTDADGDRHFRYELVEGPQGMRIDAFRGKLTWKPEQDQAGKHRVEIAVTDRNGGRSTQSFLIPVVVKELGADREEDSPPASTP
jgi:hypothetical protein